MRAGGEFFFLSDSGMSRLYSTMQFNFRLDWIARLRVAEIFFRLLKEPKD